MFIPLDVAGYQAAAGGVIPNERNCMKNWKIVLLIVWLAMVGLMCLGCNGITADASHAALIDSTSAWAGAVSIKANVPDSCPDCVGALTKDQVKSLFKSNAVLWRYFQQAKSGQGVMPAVPAGE